METKSKENIKIVKELQGLLKSNKKLNEKSLQGIGINPALKEQKFRNIIITNDFWSGLNVSVIDSQKDLDGKPISENQKLILRVKNLYENGSKKIAFSDLLDLNIWTAAKELVIGNLRLRNNSDFLVTYEHYEIQIVDDKKNLDGLWVDKAITTDRILDVLHKYDLTAKQLSKMKEMDLNKELELHFKKYFETVKKGGRSNQGDIDLMLGSNHNYGIELKLAKELSKASASQKAIGQIEIYTRQFKGNFMVIVAGLLSDKNDKSVSEVARKAKDCESRYYYLEAH